MIDNELKELVRQTAQIAASTAKSCQANSEAIAELRQEIRELRRIVLDQQTEITQSHREFLDTRDAFSDAIGQMLRISDQQQRTLDFLLEQERNR